MHYLFLSVHTINTVFVISFPPLTYNQQKYLNLLVGRIVTKLVGRAVKSGKMRSAHFILVIAFNLFQMSKTKLKVVPYWIKVDVLKQFAENCSYLFCGIVDV